MITTQLQTQQWDTTLNVVITQTTDLVELVDGQSVCVTSRVIDGDRISSLRDEIQRDLININVKHPNAVGYRFALYAMEHNNGRTIARYSKLVMFK